MPEEKKSKYTGYTKAQGRASMKYAKLHLKRVSLDLSKESYNQVKAYAESRGESTAGFIKRAISEAMKRGA